MDTLDRDRVRALAEAFALAEKSGFGSLSSPIDILLEAAVDLCLLLKNAFNEGGRKRKTNPSIKELDVSDSLGNPKMIKIFKENIIIRDPRISSIMEQFAAFFVNLKKSPDTALSFYESVVRTRFLPPKVSKDPSITKEIQRMARFEHKQSKRAYYRRLRKNRSKKNE